MKIKIGNTVAELQRVQIFAWEEPDGTRHRWNVSEMIEVIRYIREHEDPDSLSTIDFSLSDARECLAKNWRQDKLDEQHVDEVDLREPIILIEHFDRMAQRNAHILVDGWHRIAKQVKTNREEPIKAYVLPQSVADMFKL